MEETFKRLTKLIKSCERIIFMTHQNMDLDGFSSILALSEIVSSFKKESFVLIDNKQNDTSIEKSFKLLKDNEFEFNFIYKKDVNKLLDENTLIFVLDVHRPNLTEMPSLLSKTKNVVVIDHHLKCKQYIQDTLISYLNSNMSSTIEIICNYLKYLNKSISPLIATMMLAGMEIDTNSFNVKTTAKTFETAAYLINMGADNILKQELLKEDKAEYIERQKYIESSYMINKNIAICPLDNKIVDNNILAQIAEDLLQFDSVEVSFCIGYISKNKIGISARSIGNYDVEKIMKNLGGGGHLTEAATQIKNINIESAINLLINEIDNQGEVI